jgi:hypothetical protein
MAPTRLQKENRRQSGLVGQKTAGACQAVSERRIFLDRFLCSTWSRFLRPDPRSIAKPARAGAAKVGRRANLAAYSGFARPHLDSFKHDRTLGAVGMTIRGEPAFRARINRATTLYSVGPGTRTMMHSCASAAKLRGGGPILFPGMKAKGGDRDPATSNRHRHRLALEAGRAEAVGGILCNSAHKAGRRTIPSGIAPSRRRCLIAIWSAAGAVSWAGAF